MTGWSGTSATTQGGTLGSSRDADKRRSDSMSSGSDESRGLENVGRESNDDDDPRRTITTIRDDGRCRDYYTGGRVRRWRDHEQVVNHYSTTYTDTTISSTGNNSNSFDQERTQLVKQKHHSSYYDDYDGACTGGPRPGDCVSVAAQFGKSQMKQSLSHWEQQPLSAGVECGLLSRGGVRRQLPRQATFCTTTNYCMVDFVAQGR